MYIIVAPIQIKDGHKDEFIAALLDDAKGSVNDEPGCLRFDVVQDAHGVGLHLSPAVARQLHGGAHAHELPDPLAEVPHEVLRILGIAASKGHCAA